MLLLDLKASSKFNKVCSFLGVPRVRPRVMTHQKYESQSHNHDMTNKES
jgi:hypothetical protein